MKKLYSKLIIMAMVAIFSLPVTLVAQKGPSKTDPTAKKIKEINGCPYQVVPGLAEITSMKVIMPKDESILEYDEHEVFFRFKPMEGDQLIEQIRDTDIEFYLFSGNLRVPIGPEYIEQFRIKKGGKYAMTMLQATDREACTGRLYRYESKALVNDLFEADKKDNLYLYKKNKYAVQQQKREQEYEENKSKSKAEDAKNEVSPVGTETTDEAIANTTTVEIEDQPDLSNLSEEEIRKIAEEELRKELEGGSTSTTGTTGINEAAIRAELEEELRKKYAEELANAGKTLSAEETAESEESSSTTSNAQAIRDAKRKAKEDDRKKREENARKQKAAEEKAKKEAELKAKLKAELEEQIKKEIKDKELAAKQKKDEEEKAKEEALNKKRKALEKKEAIKKEMMERIANETKRKECTFGDRISGTIEVLKVSKVKDAGESLHGHTEYEVLVTFRPDNFGELTKKEKKEWEAAFTFSLDPKGQNANPGAGYIRKYKVFKATQYKGFAQIKQEGICNSIMVYSPDLPNDVSKIKLK